MTHGTVNNKIPPGVLEGHQLLEQAEIELVYRRRERPNGLSCHREGGVPSRRN